MLVNLLRRIVNLAYSMHTHLFLKLHKNITMGEYSYGYPIVLFGQREKTFLRIGKFCSLTPYKVTFFLGGNHRTEWISTYPFTSFFRKYSCIKGHPCSNGNITIGNDVWIGRDSAIMSGINIGDGAVVGANALVTKDVPPYAIVGGNPAKIIRYRFPSETIELLLRIKWWDWGIDDIERAVPLLLSDDINGFIEYARTIEK